MNVLCCHCLSLKLRLLVSSLVSTNFSWIISVFRAIHQQNLFEFKTRNTSSTALVAIISKNLQTYNNITVILISNIQHIYQSVQVSQSECSDVCEGKSGRSTMKIYHEDYNMMCLLYVLRRTCAKSIMLKVLYTGTIRLSPWEYIYIYSKSLTNYRIQVASITSRHFHEPNSQLWTDQIGKWKAT